MAGEHSGRVPIGRNGGRRRVIKTRNEGKTKDHRTDAKIGTTQPTFFERLVKRLAWSLTARPVFLSSVKRKGGGRESEASVVYSC